MQSGNSLYAIVHAKYGQRLSEEDYKTLVASRSVSEVAAYLRNKTIYAEALRSIRGNDIHRGHLEQLLKRWAIEENNRLARFEKGISANYYSYTYLQNSINEILAFMRMLSAGREKEYVLFMPRDSENYPAVDLNALSASVDLGEVVESIKDKELRKVLAKLQSEELADENNSSNYTVIEFALKRYLVEKQLELAKKCGKSTYKEISEICGAWCELENVERIYRMKRFGVQDTDYIRRFLFERYYKIRPSVMEKMIAARNENEVFELFNQTYYKRYEELVRYHDINNYSRCIYFLMLKHRFTFSVDPLVSVCVYNRLRDYEVQNVFRIIESVRYGLDKKEISKNLVGYREV